MLVVLATAEGWSSLTSLLQNSSGDNGFQMTLRSLGPEAVCDLSVEDRSISLHRADLKEDMSHTISDSSQSCRGGTDAFLLLVHGGLYTEKEQRLVEILQAHFGAEALKHLVILSVEDGKVADTLDDALVDLINVCEGRYCRIRRWAAGGGLQALQEMVKNVVAEKNSAGYTEATLARSNRSCTEDLAMNMLRRKLQEAEEKRRAFMEEVQKQEERRARETEELRAQHQEERRKEAAEEKQHKENRENLHEAVSSHRCMLQLQRTAPEDDETQRISVVLLGLTGSGKSSALNLILNRGRNQYWSQDPGQDPVPPTVTCERKEMSAGGKRLILVDTPELWDEDGVEDLDLVKDCLALALPGPHVFLLVLQVGRFTQVESEILGHLQRVFGREVAEHAIILFVRFDGNQSEPQRIDQYVSGSHPSLQDLVRRCGSRYFELNLSRSRSPLSYAQVKELLSGIHKLVASHGDRRFAVRRFSAQELQDRTKVLAERRAGAQEENCLLTHE
ncbi:GTPase IMAP family member 7 [Austrofundulus limnaeus]|uniref:GTPase IMAP family member 7 n=1 Tax=Austrofundulus limnaeus TaxID=52670 RepID=A0A2I4BHP2_AUSLI|nr:PREDICTED: GTPase IMAP family member 7-like [Austrofundulus limnaeus]